MVDLQYLNMDTFINDHQFLLEKMKNENSTLVLTDSNNASYIFQDMEQYKMLHNAISLLKIVKQSEQDILENGLVDNDEVFEELLKD